MHNKDLPAALAVYFLALDDKFDLATLALLFATTTAYL
jgi:hypothetical protein